MNSESPEREYRVEFKEYGDDTDALARRDIYGGVHLNRGHPLVNRIYWSRQQAICGQSEEKTPHERAESEARVYALMALVLGVVVEIVETPVLAKLGEALDRLAKAWPDPNGPVPSHSHGLIDNVDRVLLVPIPKSQNPGLH
jgi:hypothetical protein